MVMSPGSGLKRVVMSPGVGLKRVVMSPPSPHRGVGHHEFESHIIEIITFLTQEASIRKNKQKNRILDFCPNTASVGQT